MKDLDISVKEYNKLEILTFNFIAKNYILVLFI